MSKKPRKTGRDAGLKTSAPVRHGRIIGRKGPVYFLVDENGHEATCVARGAAKRAVVGDLVNYQADMSTEMSDGVLTKIEPRRSELFRTDALGRRPQTIVANIDHIFIIVAAIPEMREGLIDRYLVAARAQAIKSSLVFNKLDLISPDQKTTVDERLDVYRSLGIDVFETSIHVPSTIEALSTKMSSMTSIFVGHSGVGKTSLINALCPNVSEKVQAVSEATGRGQHTTTTSWAYPLPTGGEIIDSPGIRSFGLWGISPDELREHFIEFLELQDECRFANCQHISEPKCAVQSAVHDARISVSRYNSYLRIRESLLDESKNK